MLAGLTLSLAGASSFLLGSSDEQPIPAERESIGWTPPHEGWMGTASCGASACHGGDGPQGSKGCEYSTWAESDPHARGYQSLFSARSIRIAKALWPNESDPAPWKKSLCLQCHTSFEGLSDTASSPHGTSTNTNSVNPAYGVGCESCHGPAKQWIAAHTTSKWAVLTAAEKEGLGFRDLHQPVSRAETCVRCHIGAGSQQVDHDLIAAGHPRLQFNMVGFSEAPPTASDKSYRGNWHWLYRRNIVNAESRGTTLAREWTVGEVVSAIASLQLLEYRLQHSSGSSWPELAEFNCFACHHDLTGQTSITDADFAVTASPPQTKGLRAGQLAWGIWSYSTLVPIAHASGLDAKTIREDLFSIQKLVAGSEDDRRKAAKIAGSMTHLLRFELLPLVERQSFDSEWLSSVRSSLITEAKSSLAHMTWDQAAQWYVAFTVLDRLEKDLSTSSPDRERMAARAPEGLRYPAGFDSPRGFSPSVLADFLKTIENAKP